ncbi:hypothetical protein KDN32_07420 [Nocardioides sp. J2M5]|uniref:hypothetical protein n=1 Tax=Nocardioides palaemonis TaxID=2829810 RepID=UPI001BAC4500|nr:hypothetical protein [Nocardioides palaemonis]MBS2937568.1 hypothetical protein [Nocardioides palaemonis]
MSDETSALLLQLADDLYALPLADFTPARDALVKEHRADKGVAAAVKGLRKASVAAWVVNLLVRRDPDQVDQVLAVGAALREAQADLDAAQLRELTRQRRQLTASVTTAARRLARLEGVKVTQSVADQVEATLTAAMLEPEAARAVRSGLLVTALAATGLGDLDVSGSVALPEALGFSATARPAPGSAPGAAPGTTEGRPQLHVVPDPDAEAKARAAADERLADARATLAAAEKEHRGTRRGVEKLQARTLQLQSEIDELRSRVATLDATLEEVDDELSEAEALHEETGEAVEEARAEVDAARDARDRL